MDRLTFLLDHVNALKQLPRTGWLLAGVADPESVADHSFLTSILALFLAESINGVWAEEGLDAPLDAARVACLALIHDLAECILTDLPKQSTELLGEEVKHRAEASAMAQLLTALPAGSEYLELWREYDAASTPEARLVKDADKLEMVHQALQYSRRGHTNLDEFLQGHRFHYHLSQDLMKRMLAE